MIANLVKLEDDFLVANQTKWDSATLEVTDQPLSIIATMVRSVEGRKGQCSRILPRSEGDKHAKSFDRFSSNFSFIPQTSESQRAEK